MTPSSTPSSDAYANCHLEWGPSRQLALMLLLLGVLAAGALFASDLPSPWAWGGAPCVLIHAAWAARREWARPWRTLVLPTVPADDAGELPAPLLDDTPLATLAVSWRGPVAFLRCRAADGRRHRTVLWPDTTTDRTRRDLRLALRDRATSPSRPSMAP